MAQNISPHILFHGHFQTIFADWTGLLNLNKKKNTFSLHITQHKREEVQA